MSRNQHHIHLRGEIEQVLAAGQYRVRTDNGFTVLAQIAGRMRRFRVRIVLGDSVTVAVSPYDATRGLIVKRMN